MLQKENQKSLKKNTNFPRGIVWLVINRPHCTNCTESMAEQTTPSKYLCLIASSKKEKRKVFSSAYSNLHAVEGLKQTLSIKIRTICQKNIPQVTLLILFIKSKKINSSLYFKHQNSLLFFLSKFRYGETEWKWVSVSSTFS